jgi:hypothetical protein
MGNDSRDHVPGASARRELDEHLPSINEDAECRTLATGGRAGRMSRHRRDRQFRVVVAKRLLK